jgi:hypothetical protein
MQYAIAATGSSHPVLDQFEKRRVVIPETVSAASVIRDDGRFDLIQFKLAHGLASAQLDDLT